MTVLTLEPTRWADTIESSVDCLFSPQSAKNVEDVLSKTSTRKHQKNLLKAVEPFILKMLENPVGISILTSLVKYGTVTTVASVTDVVGEECDKVLRGASTPAEICETPLGILLERIIYREDCTGECRINLIKRIKCLDHCSLMGSAIFLLATARLIILDREFAVSVCSSTKAQEAFLKFSLPSSRKNIVVRFCEYVLYMTHTKDEVLTELCSAFIFTALSTLYAADSSVRPWKEVTFLLASCGSTTVVRDMIKLFAQWPDIFVRSKNEYYAKVIAHLLARSQESNDGVVLIKVLFKTKKDFDERLTSRKSSQLQLLAAIAEKPAYVAAVSEKFGESLEKKLLAAAVRYRNTTKPRALVTKEVLLQRLDNIRSVSSADASPGKALKRRRE
ncbi:hypothetical protein TraAM80_05688 [Trypanosoma rangeli]|uniref:Uncharacterized protein n=1 Tax=Trypanosoma rangeli TaxID=5698 RepID=A0A422NDW9_TRYRA|nr:uncharacterized protein TraAM80_05688 [Trypanosoma rangeli]RNF03704.1 hypothetical protein TraAM80_05688 [Trypanosoma rangeli]|eukprot:RNF03704.1 hypothetical protein TraAM80_05688 [Trypanosoma rangeli]